MSEKKYTHLLKDVDVTRWYRNVARGAQSTAEVALRGLGRFCIALDTTPHDFTTLTEKRISEMLMDYITLLEKEGKAGSYVESCLKPVKSWLQFNGIELKRKIKIKNARSTPTLKNERVPTQEELKRIFLSATKATRVSCVLMAQSGLRPEVLGDYLGKDGLRLGDIPDIEIIENKVKFIMVPARIVVREELSKTGRQYFTFIGNEGAMYLGEYLNDRLRAGEKLSVETPIIVPRNSDSKFIRTINIGDQIRKAIRNAGLPWRPYVLRSYFDTQLMMAESKGYILRDYRQFFMGHVGDIEHTYTVNRHNLPDNVLEDMRNAYSRSTRYLETDNKELAEEEMKRNFKREILHLDGFTDEEIIQLGLLDMNDDELREKRKEKLFGAALNGNKQKVIGLSEVESFIEGGWEYVGALPGEKAIIRPPE